MVTGTGQATIETLRRLVGAFSFAGDLATHCRLADPGRSLQEQRRGPPSHRPDEGPHLGELGVPPEDPVNRLVHQTPPATAPTWRAGTT